MSEDDFALAPNLRPKQPPPPVSAEAFHLKTAQALSLSLFQSNRLRNPRLSTHNTCLVLPPEEALLEAANRASYILSAQGGTNLSDYALQNNQKIYNLQNNSRTGTLWYTAKSNMESDSLDATIDITSWLLAKKQECDH